MQLVQSKSHACSEGAPACVLTEKTYGCCFHGDQWKHVLSLTSQSMGLLSTLPQQCRYRLTSYTSLQRCKHFEIGGDKKQKGQAY